MKTTPPTTVIYPKKGELIPKLESILTIDGKGRPKKAQELIELMATVNTVDLLEAIKEIAERKFL